MKYLTIILLLLTPSVLKAMPTPESIDNAANNIFVWVNIIISSIMLIILISLYKVDNSWSWFRRLLTSLISLLFIFVGVVSIKQLTEVIDANPALYPSYIISGIMIIFAFYIFAASLFKKSIVNQIKQM